MCNIRKCQAVFCEIVTTGWGTRQCNRRGDFLSRSARQWSRTSNSKLPLLWGCANLFRPRMPGWSEILSATVDRVEGTGYATYIGILYAHKMLVFDQCHSARKYVVQTEEVCLWIYGSWLSSSTRTTSQALVICIAKTRTSKWHMSAYPSTKTNACLSLLRT